MSQPKFSQRQMSEACYNQEKRRRHMKACQHDKRTFKLGDDVIGFPPILVCDRCGQSVHGQEAKERRDEADTIETNIPLPSGQ